MRLQRCRHVRLFGEAKAQFHSPDTSRQLLNDNPGRLRYPWRALGSYLQQHEPLVQNAVVFQIEGESGWHEVVLRRQIDGGARHSNRRTRLSKRGEECVERHRVRAAVREGDSTAPPPNQHQTQRRGPDDQWEPAAVRDLVQIGRDERQVEREK